MDLAPEGKPMENPWPWFSESDTLVSRNRQEPAMLWKWNQAQRFLIHSESQRFHMSHPFSLSNPCESSVSKL